ncbi:hypothetical protein NQ314_010349 [Rhamnusium bicolor]|uniref:Uncharacterized protein n=1 Tax=Rhamnusium bicolor TaxID=1586634 RepID=A0AAV8XSF4_9CUCU|nr:hypothetical protein NQ314_010349 [Rhamnusium bicolor]
MECIICKKTVSSDDKSVVQRPKKQGLLSLISSAEKRQDDCGKQILLQRDGILSGKIKVKYHVDCRQNYTSQQNISSSQSIGGQTSQSVKPISITRHSNSHYNIRTMCLIYNKSGTKNKRQLVSVQTGYGKSTYLKIMDAANQRDDIDMIAKLTGYEDLFAYDAKYHKLCYNHYISQRHIKSHIRAKNNPEATHLPDNFDKFNSSSIDFFFCSADIREAVIPCNVIMGLFDKSFKKNSFHVGLGLHIYHLIPSKHILDILSQLGLTCSYNDIRQLSTALAKGDIDDKKHCN